MVAVAVRGDRGSQQRPAVHPRQDRDVAVALRGDRGSQRQLHLAGERRPEGVGCSPGLPRFATAADPAGGCLRRSGDRPPQQNGILAVVLRGGRGSQVQRLDERGDVLLVWRSPSGGTEDGNFRASLSRRRRSCDGCRRGDRGSQPHLAVRDEEVVAVTVALWGDRGSQHRHRCGHERHGGSGGRPAGRSRIATAHRTRHARSSRSGGRPPGRPRIATTARSFPATRGDQVAVALPWDDSGSQPPRLGARPAVARQWRLPCGVTVAVALCGDRGSQRHVPVRVIDLYL
jgi:hypothetical protein